MISTSIKRTLTISMALVLAMATATVKAQSSADDITGKWQNPSNGRVIEIYKESNAYFGKIAEDKNDKLPAGTVILKNIQFIANGSWKGTMIPPKRGRDIPCSLTMTDKENLTVKVSAMGRSKTLEYKRG